MAECKKLRDMIGIGIIPWPRPIACTGAPPVATGACCTGGVCEIKTQAACTAGGGTYYGDNSTCTVGLCTGTGGE
jgi:hypothetical protein